MTSTGVLSKSETSCESMPRKCIRPQPPSAISAFRLQGLLLTTNPKEKSSTRWRGEALDRLTPSSIAAAANLLQQLGGFAALFLGPDPSVWRTANLPDGDAVTLAVDTVARLARKDWPELKAATDHFVDEVHAESVRNLLELRKLLEAQRRINEFLSDFDPSVFACESGVARNLHIAGKEASCETFFLVFQRKYRRAVGQLRALSVDPKVSPRSLDRVNLAVSLLSEWRNFAEKERVASSIDRSIDAWRFSNDWSTT